MDSDSDPFFEEESSSSEEDIYEERRFNTNWQEVKENDPFTTELRASGHDQSVQNMTDEEWEELGRGISNNTHLKKLAMTQGALNDHNMSFLFRGLTRSNSIQEMVLTDNGFSVTGVRSMVPFLRNNSLKFLDLGDNNLQSEGFNVLMRALGDSPIENLCCNNCGIESIEIDRNNIHQHLEFLYLYDNSINVDGCRGLVQLLQGADATLKYLHLQDNQIDDEGVAILVNALKRNTSLEEFDIRHNDGISVEGTKLLLQLVNDISTIKATLQSNHTLQTLTVKEIQYDGGGDDDDDDDDDVKSQIQRQIDYALEINTNHEHDPEAAGRAKVICTQLHSGTRAELAELQGVDRSLYSEINPLHLPEVLALVGRRHGQRELYVALKSSIAGVISIVNRKECIQQQIECIHQQMASYAARLEVLGAELAAINEAEEDVVEIGSESRGNKRRRA